MEGRREEFGERGGVIGGEGGEGAEEGEGKEGKGRRGAVASRRFKSRLAGSPTQMSGLRPQPALPLAVRIPSHLTTRP